MIEDVESGNERIGRLLDELATYGVIDAGADPDADVGVETDAGAESDADPEGGAGVGSESGVEVGAGTGVDANGRIGSNDAASGTVTVSPEATNGSNAAGVEGVVADVEVDFDDAMIKENLEVILLVFVSMRDGAHGKRLMGDLSDVFGAQLSPGTVYPRLHELEAAGVLSVHELVRTKEYTIADEARARELVERAMGQHFALGAVFRSALERA